jgi:phenylacetic acid degradation protein
MPCYSLDGVIPVVHPTAYVHPTAVLIGSVVIGAGCYIGPCASLRGDFGRIIIRAGANLQDSCVVHSFPGQDALVEEDGHIGHSAILHGCTVGKDAMVGMNAVVMDEAEIGARSIVGACAFVPARMKVPERSLVLGAPAKVVRALSDEEISRKQQGTLAYQRLAQRCLQSMTEVSPLAGLD